MYFWCEKHGKQTQVSHNGYNLGHSTPRNGPNELDLEDIIFVFDVVSDSPDEGLELELVSHNATNGYLSKFADWEQHVTAAAENEYEQHCPECGNGRIMWHLEDNEELPEDAQ